MNNTGNNAFILTLKGNKYTCAHENKTLKLCNAWKLIIMILLGNIL